MSDKLNQNNNGKTALGGVLLAISSKHLGVAMDLPENRKPKVFYSDHSSNRYLGVGGPSFHHEMEVKHGL
jgi:hypothetical protein